MNQNLIILGLILNFQNISELKPDSFSSFPNLFSIGLGDNAINMINKNAFRGLNSLIGLHLNRNRIIELADGAFDVLVPFKRLEAHLVKDKRYILHHFFIPLC